MKRYGKNRLFANGAVICGCGYLDVATAEVVTELADPTATIGAQLRGSHRALDMSAAHEVPCG